MYWCKQNWRANNKTVAILSPNLLGICGLAQDKRDSKYNLIVIEDSADTIGSTINNINTGQYTDISISFYGSHIINCAGNGGALQWSKTTFNKVKLLRHGSRSSLFDENNSESIENNLISI